MAFRFVQISDVHLGARMTASALRLPPKKARIRRGELQSVLADACQLASDEKADALLIPGDLFDDESALSDDIGFTIESFGHFGRPVIIAPGNHDYMSSASYYAQSFLSSRFGMAWPNNVHIFSRQAWNQLQVAEIPGVCFTGIAFETHVQLSNRMLIDGICSARGTTNVLLFHGSREAFAPQGKLVTLPFTDEELAATRCDYAAIGHYHSAGVIEVGGKVIGAYSGTPAGRGLDECGEKVVLIGEIGEDRRVQLSPVRLDRRQILRVSVECTGLLSNRAILNLTETRVDASGATAEDIVYVDLVGRVPSDLILSLSTSNLEDRFFHVQISAGDLQPSYDLTQFEEGGPDAMTTEGRFVRSLLKRVRDAEAAGDIDAESVARQAIMYGLDALRSGRVRPRDIN